MAQYQGFMTGAMLHTRVFSPTQDADHEHCVMCGAKFSMDRDDLQHGYADDAGHWVCPDCLGLYQEEYRWALISSHGTEGTVP